jgi:hypothetical protein
MSATVIAPYFTAVRDALTGNAIELEFYPIELDLDPTTRDVHSHRRYLTVRLVPMALP